MAKINFIIQAFDSEELQMLVDILNRREKQATEEDFILPHPFQELKDKVQLASKYANAINREHNI